MVATHRLLIFTWLMCCTVIAGLSGWFWDVLESVAPPAAAIEADTAAAKSGTAAVTCAAKVAPTSKAGTDATRAKVAADTFSAGAAVTSKASAVIVAADKYSASKTAAAAVAFQR